MNTKEILNSYQERKAKQRRFWSIFTFVIFVFIVINIVLHFVLFPIKQKSISMLPDIPKESVIMTTPLSTSYRRGDVVIVDARKIDDRTLIEKLLNLITSFFTGQQYFLNEQSDMPGTKPKLRRVIGLPGDTIYMRDYVLYVKPAGEKHFLTEFEITDKPYNVTFYAAPAGWDSSIGAKGSFSEILLGDDEYFVLADNRKATDDSRLWGPVPKKEIASKALFCYSPFSNLKIF